MRNTEIQESVSEQLSASTGLSSLDQLLGKEGYPDKPTKMVVGPPGIGKEAIGYWFIQSGLMQKDFCLNVTRLPTRNASGR